MRSEVQIFPDPPAPSSLPDPRTLQHAPHSGIEICGGTAIDQPEQTWSLIRISKRVDAATKFKKNFRCSLRTLTQDFFWLARRNLSERGSVQTVHDRASTKCNAASRKKDKSGGHSSAGRAPALHAGGRRFDPAWLHHIFTLFD